jgi:DNA-binding NarL/FixJ family response regulator
MPKAPHDIISPASGPTPIKVSVVEDHQQTREMLFALISLSPGLVCTGAHSNPGDALKKLAAEKPDVLLLDLELPGIHGEDLIVALAKNSPRPQIIVLTVHSEPERLFAALEAGAIGYLVKPAAATEIVAAIKDAHSGGSPMSSQIARLVIQTFNRRGQSKQLCDDLTPREEEILRLLAQGQDGKEIADLLSIAPRTVGTHLHHIYDKLHVNSRLKAVAKFFGRSSQAL